MHVRKGDTVLVIAGNDKGKQGEIRQVFLDENRVIVAGVNLRWKHSKRTQQNPKGERVQREAPIHASNVMHVDPKTGERSRKRVKPARAGKAAKAGRPADKKKAAAKADER
jgi:large subunit ribosomal protein L24